MLKGTLRLGITHSNKEDDFMTIEVVDELSGTQVLEVKVDLKTFAEVVFGQRFGKCEFELWPEHCGKIAERKTEKVLLPKDHIYNKAALRAAVAALEIDGWMGSVRDAENHHNWCKKDGKDAVLVHYIRYVAASPPPEILRKTEA